MDDKKKQISDDIYLRAWSVYGLFIAAALIVVVRLIYVCFFSTEIEYNTERMLNRIFRVEEVPAHRGSILARDGEPLATSIWRYQIEMDYGSEGFDSLELYKIQVDSLSKLLSAYFKDRTPQQYSSHMMSQRQKHYKLLNRRDSQVVRSEGWFSRMVDRMMQREYKTMIVHDTIRDHKRVPLLPRHIDYTEWETLRHYPILNWNMGLTYDMTHTDERVYPQGDLARRTIGKLLGDRGTDYGVEKVCSTYLAGTTGMVKRQRIARGFYTTVADDKNIDPVDGLDVVTTLDVELQDVAHRALLDQLERQNAIWGTAIVMEVETGNIAAMVNLGRSMSREGAFSEQRENYALRARAEPGSTFKLATTIALLDDAGMSPEQVYNTGDGKKVRVGAVDIQDSHGGYTDVDLKTAFAQSLNVYFAKAVWEHYKDDQKRYTDFLRELHLDRCVGLEEFGSMAPLFIGSGDKGWYRTTNLPNIAYGYAIEVTPLQTLTLYNAIANGGKMVAPKLIESVKRGDNVVERYPTKVLNPKICSNSTLKTIKGYLEEVSASGTAKYYLGNFENFSVGAKTGTAQFAQGNIKYSDGYYMGSMVSYMPADEPRYSIITVMFTRYGYGTTYYGAGLTGNVQQKIIQHLYNREPEWFDDLRGTPRENYPTQIKGGIKGDVERVADRLARSTDVEGDRHSQWAHTSIDSLQHVTIQGFDTTSGLMPNVYGMPLRDAMFLLESCGLKVRFEGSGRVWRQSIRRDTRIKRGQVVSISLK